VDISPDIHSPSAAQQIAACLIPSDGSTPPLLADAARHLLAAICLSFIKSSPLRWTLRDVILATRDRERLFLSAEAQDFSPSPPVAFFFSLAGWLVWRVFSDSKEKALHASGMLIYYAAR